MLAGAGYALVFVGFISLVLAVINLFPFLPLDGGHVLWSVAEKVRGRRISLAAMYRYSSVGIVLLLFLVINGISNDISRLGADRPSGLPRRRAAQLPTGLTHTQLLTSGPKRSGCAGPNSDSSSARLSSEISSQPPVAPRRQ